MARYDKDGNLEYDSVFSDGHGEYFPSEGTEACPDCREDTLVITYHNSYTVVMECESKTCLFYRTEELRKKLY